MKHPQYRGRDGPSSFTRPQSNVLGPSGLVLGVLLPLLALHPTSWRQNANETEKAAHGHIRSRPPQRLLHKNPPSYLKGTLYSLTPACLAELTAAHHHNSQVYARRALQEFKFKREAAWGRRKPSRHAITYMKLKQIVQLRACIRNCV